MKTLQTIQNELRELVVQGTDLVLAALKKALKPGSDCYNDCLTIEGRYQDISRKLLQGIVSNEDATLEFNKIRQAVLDFIDCLKESDLSELNSAVEAASSGMDDVYNGEVLYRIPKRMQLGIESECIIRLAFDRKKILDEFQVQVGDVMKDLRISDVMGVELLDPNADKAFSITTLNDTVQFVEKDLVTEWIFCVTPLKQGQFPLVLKISIIEIINGIERKRNEVLKEQVEILTDKTAEAEADFMRGYAWQVLDTDEQRAVPGGGRSGGAAPPVPPSVPAAPSPSFPGPAAPSPAPPRPAPTSPQPSPQVPTAPKSGNMKKVGTVLGALAALIFSVWAMKGFFVSNNSDIIAPPPMVAVEEDPEWQGVRQRRNKQELEEFVQKYPGTNVSAEAMILLDTLENEAWQEAVASNDYEGLQDYLEQYPEGKYAADVATRMDEMNRGIEAVVIDTTRFILDTPRIEKIIEDKPVTKPRSSSTKPKPVVPKKQIPSKQQTPTRPKPSPTKPRTETTKPSKPTNAAEPVDPNKPIPLVSASRRPVFRNCGSSNKQREEKCTVEKIYNYLKGRFRYPEEAMDKSIEGTVVVSFVVERDGAISEVKALNDIGGGCAKEAERLIKQLPKFKPGLNAKGSPVRVLFTQPVRFKLE